MHRGQTKLLNIWKRACDRTAIYSLELRADVLKFRLGEKKKKKKRVAVKLSGSKLAQINNRTLIFSS